MDVLEKAQFPDITIHRFTSLTLERELESNTNSVIPFFSMNIGFMIAFCVVTCMMTDWVKSKPLLGLFGVISAVMGTLSAFGFCMYVGVPFIGINLAAPFLMLGKQLKLFCSNLYKFNNKFYNTMSFIHNV